MKKVQGKTVECFSHILYVAGVGLLYTKLDTYEVIFAQYCDIVIVKQNKWLKKPIYPFLSELRIQEVTQKIPVKPFFNMNKTF